MIIKKAVIAAAGRGTRFLPVVKGYPKELVPILAKPNLQYLIEEAIGAGITDIGIVIREGETKIQQYFSPDTELEKYLTETNKIQYLDSLKAIWSKAKLTFIPQPTDLPYGTGSPVLAAKQFIGNDDFAYFYGDDYVLEPVPGQLLSRMSATINQFQASAVISVQQVPDEEVSRYGTIKYLDDPQYPHRMTAIMEKLPASETPSHSALLGRFLVSNQILQFIDTNQLSRDGELWFTNALTKLAQISPVLTESLQNEQWLTTGDPLRWLKANIAVALQDSSLNSDLRAFIQSKI